MKNSMGKWAASYSQGINRMCSLQIEWFASYISRLYMNISWRDRWATTLHLHINKLCPGCVHPGMKSSMGNMACSKNVRGQARRLQKLRNTGSSPKASNPLLLHTKRRATDTSEMRKSMDKRSSKGSPRCTRTAGMCSMGTLTPMPGWPWRWCEETCYTRTHTHTHAHTHIHTHTHTYTRTHTHIMCVFVCVCVCRCEETCGWNPSSFPGSVVGAWTSWVSNLKKTMMPCVLPFATSGQIECVLYEYNRMCSLWICATFCDVRCVCAAFCCVVLWAREQHGYWARTKRWCPSWDLLQRPINILMWLLFMGQYIFIWIEIGIKPEGNDDAARETFCDVRCACAYLFVFIFCCV